MKRISAQKSSFVNDIKHDLNLRANGHKFTVNKLKLEIKIDHIPYCKMKF